MISKEKFFEVMDEDGIPRKIAEVIWKDMPRVTAWIPEDINTEKRQIAAIRSANAAMGVKDWDVADLAEIEKSLKAEADRMERIGQLYKLLNLRPTSSNFQRLTAIIN